MIHVVQLSDPHLFADPGGRLYDINTRDTLCSVIRHAQSQLPAIDLLLVTGDLVHDETEAGYKDLHKLIQSVEAPAYFLPGNHDNPAMMQKVLPNTTHNGLVCAERDSWLIILLDSSERGRVEGVLTPATLDRLAELLTTHDQKHVLIALHHHVIDVKSPWLDALNLRNNMEFLTLLKRFPNVQLVVNGHIHQELDVQRDHIRFLGSPATCFQFTANRDNAGIDTAPPGYRHIVLQDDGRIETAVHYVHGG
ncbi:MAG: metallophosphoesterase [Gammaproteobacteria bacterium]|jgi:Icc protein